MAKRFKYRAGFTLIEIMVATVILVIVILGTSGFIYHANLGAREAEAKMTGARTAQLLCESWRGASEPNTFDPTVSASSYPASVLTIEPYSATYDAPLDFTLLGIFRITAEGTDYYAVLCWKDIYPGLRALNVAVVWDARNPLSEYFRDSAYNKSFRLTTYITY